MFAPRELGILNEREVRDTALRLLERVGTKFAVRAISEGLRKEEYANNIRTTIISPGMVTTELTESITDVNFKPVVEKM
ncbi:SDR family NAD(P)-dependent oxidoreductase [Paenibacillus sp. 23TSA30-6]|nr:SDR family NAD(P)-dependent oxidoreductase [Paenibacillus sp. 23TSA30-6]MBE0335946.1 SDR family NAD(P)-dependent oxidoreductase [Paenibacillus sp. 23TSA30-6]